MTINMGGMGMGTLGSAPLIFKSRKHRWMMEILDPDTGNILVPKVFVKVAARPQIDVQETEINFLDKQFIPGKMSSQSVTFTYIDMEQNDAAHFFTRHAAAYWVKPSMPVVKSTYVLELLDGCGTSMEKWELFGGFMTSIKYGELDCTATANVDMEVEVRYDKVQYTAFAQPEMSFKSPDEFVMPEEWKIHTPVEDVKGSSSPGQDILDQFLRRTVSK